MTRETDPAKRRREILAAALEAFDASGYAETTMDEVAAKAGISKGSIYNYFHGKQDLFEHVFTDSVAPDEADIDRMLAEPRSAVDRLVGYVDYCFDQMARYRRIGKLVLEFWATAAREQEHANLAWSLHELHGRAMDRLGRIVTEGVEAGEFGKDLDPQIAAVLILAAVDGIILHAIVLGLEFGPPFVQAFKAGLIGALQPGPSAAETRTEGQSNE